MGKQVQVKTLKETWTSLIRGLTYYVQAFVCEAENNPQTTNQEPAFAFLFVADHVHEVPLNLQANQSSANLIHILS